MARLVAVLVFAFALAAPAFAQGDEQSARVTQAGDSNQRRVVQLGEHNGSVSTRQTDNGDDSTSDGNNCDPNYSGQCLEDGIGDWDCAGGEGNGPNFVHGTVDVVGRDVFGLDRDNDGVGCDEGRGGRDNGSTPRGGVDSGYGGMAPEVSGEDPRRSGPSLPLILGGVLLLSAGTGLLGVARRRRS